MSFSEQYTLLAPPLYRHLYFRTGLNRTTAGDLTSEVFTAFLAGPYPQRDLEEMARILFGIARRKIADFHRARGGVHERCFSELTPAEQAVVVSWVQEGVAVSTDPDGPQVEVTPDLRSMLGQALTALDLPTQELLLDKYVRGASVRDLAQRQGKSEPAVLSMLARARAKLRSRFSSFRKRDEREDPL